MQIRPPQVAGSFYESDAKKLEQYITQCFEDARKKQNPLDLCNIHMLLLPHAGHFYCGHIIAEALVRVHLPKRLIILCPNHTGLGRPLSVWSIQATGTDKPENGAWHTPLGNVPIDMELATEILQCIQGKCDFEANTDAHAREHSIEVILPFLQKYVPDVQIVPIAVGTGDFSALQKAGLALGEIIQKMHNQGQDVGLVVSSDMHHFSDHESTMKLDNLALEALVEFNPHKLYDVVQENKISMCGVYPAIMGLYACKVLGAHACEIINHTTSYEKGGNASRVVGYASLIVQKRTC